MSSAKRRPFCLGLNVLSTRHTLYFTEYNVMSNLSAPDMIVLYFYVTVRNSMIVLLNVLDTRTFLI